MRTLLAYLVGTPCWHTLLAMSPRPAIKGNFLSQLRPSLKNNISRNHWNDYAN